MLRSKTETVFRDFAAAIFWRISWLPNLARPLHVIRVTSALFFYHGHITLRHKSGLLAKW